MWIKSWSYREPARLQKSIISGAVFSGVVFSEFTIIACFPCPRRDSQYSHIPRLNTFPMAAPTYEPCLHVVLHQPEIPYNTGSVGRTCVALGAKLWLVRPLGFRVDNHHLKRAGLDYWQHLQWEVVEDWETLTKRLPSQCYWYFSKTASTLYTQVKFTQGDALVFGSETSGLPRSMLAENVDHALRIPIHPLARSLNLSNSVAIATFEAARQRDNQTPE